MPGGLKWTSQALSAVGVTNSNLKMKCTAKHLPNWEAQVALQAEIESAPTYFQQSSWSCSRGCHALTTAISVNLTDGSEATSMCGMITWTVRSVSRDWYCFLFFENSISFPCASFTMLCTDVSLACSTLMRDSLSCFEYSLQLALGFQLHARRTLGMILDASYQEKVLFRVISVLLKEHLSTEILTRNAVR